jgi:hypothetical protein
MLDRILPTETRAEYLVYLPSGGSSLSICPQHSKIFRLIGSIQQHGRHAQARP